MHSSRLITPLFVFAGCIAAGVQAAPVPPPAQAEAQLRATHHRFLHADGARGDAAQAPWGQDIVYIGQDGHWLDRADAIARVRRPVPRDAHAPADLRVRLFGEVAVLHGAYPALLADGAAATVRNTSVYVWTGAAWELVSAQDTLLKDPLKVEQITAAKPAIAPWRGEDPSGDDGTVLHALNAQYVQAFRDADVAWYDAHLAPDYVLVSGDGAMHDRNAALVDFAQPVFATRIRSFPVDQVRVRRFGDIALIHAENAYELKDGRKGVNRYTDIWHRQDGRWRCIAAHITVHAPPT